MMTPVVLMTSSPQRAVASTADSVRGEVIVHGPV